MLAEGARRCPECDTLLERVTEGELSLDRCPRQHGTWFDAGELRAFAASHGRHHLREDRIRARMTSVEIDAGRGRCPGCNAALARGRVEGLDLSICIRCSGFMLPIRTVNRLAPLSDGMIPTPTERFERVWSVAARIGVLFGIVVDG